MRDKGGVIVANAFQTNSTCTVNVNVILTTDHAMEDFFSI